MVIIKDTGMASFQLASIKIFILETNSILQQASVLILNISLPER